uniref:Uncharacterized protein n=1 Tax=Arundo donax TaxID=35708 RepID=A0A0A9AC20_ARUDO
MPVQELALPDTGTERNMTNQEVDQNHFHKELAAAKQKNFSLPVISTDNNKSHGGEQDIPTIASRKNQEVEQNVSPEELVRILAMHGRPPRMMERRFRKLVAQLNPMVKMPSRYDLIRNVYNFYDQEESKLKEKLKALDSRVCLSAYMWHYSHCWHSCA